jgi:hypothetical protein
MKCGRSRWLVSLVQRPKAIPKTAIPASATRLGWVCDAAPAQHAGQCRGQFCQLDQFALLELGVPDDSG